MNITQLVDGVSSLQWWNPSLQFRNCQAFIIKNINNELLPVYDRQLCECYLQPQILRCECLGDNKWFLISLKSEFVTQIWARHSNLREKFSCADQHCWYSPPGNHPELGESRSDHPELSASPIFGCGHLPGNTAKDMWVMSISIHSCTLLHDSDAVMILAWKPFHFGSIKKKWISMMINELTRCGLVTPYGNINLRLLWLKSLMAPNYHLNQCWFIIKGVLWQHSMSGDHILNTLNPVCCAASICQ